MQLNVLQWNLNVLMIFFTFHELPTFAHELNHVHFEPIETIIQRLHIAFISIYWNTHNNLMPHIFVWMN
jgi:hypothetical protein